MAYTSRAGPTPRAPIVVGAGERCRRCAARSYSPCAAILDDGLDVLARVAAHARFQPGQELVAEESEAAQSFNVTRGTVKLYKLLADGRRRIDRRFPLDRPLPRPRPGAAPPFQRHHPFSAEAVDAAEARRFSRRGLHALMADFPAFERWLHAVTPHELVAAQERMMQQMVLLGRKTAVEG